MEYFLDENCDGSYSSAGQVNPNLKWGTNYCWYVRIVNRDQSRTSGVGNFRTPNPPVLDNQNFDSGTACIGATASGRYNNSPGPATKNPITYSFEASHPDGISQLREARIAIVPRSTDLDKNYDNLNIGDYAGYIVEFNHSNPALSEYVRIGGGTPTTTGDVYGGYATLLGVNGSNTYVRQHPTDPNRYIVSFQIRFEDDRHPSEALSIYASVLGETSSGEDVSSWPDGASAGTGGDTRYHRMRSWAVDMNKPNAFAGNMKVLGVNLFELEWIADDAESGLRDVLSYCYQTGPVEEMIVDETAGQTITLPNTPVQYPSTDTCVVDENNLGAHRYRIQNIEMQGDISFSLSAIDGACNYSVETGDVLSEIPWIISKGGGISTQAGIKGISPRDIDLTDVIPNGSNDDSYLSAYNLISGNSEMPSDRRSKQNQVLLNYSNKEIKPPRVSTTDSWYDFLHGLVSARVELQSSSISQIPNSVKVSFDDVGLDTTGNLAFVDVDPLGGVLTLGDVNPASSENVSCDINTIVFVDGDLVIHPSMIRAPNSGCIFIVSGDITVESGFSETSCSAPITDPVKYDQVHGMFITDSSFITTWDALNGCDYADGLYIWGSVIADQAEFDRNLGISHNQYQPAEVFEQDAYYSENFREILSISTFSIREE